MLTPERWALFYSSLTDEETEAQRPELAELTGRAWSFDGSRLTRPPLRAVTMAFYSQPRPP